MATSTHNPKIVAALAELDKLTFESDYLSDREAYEIVAPRHGVSVRELRQADRADRRKGYTGAWVRAQRNSAGLSQAAKRRVMTGGMTLADYEAQAQAQARTRQQQPTLVTGGRHTVAMTPGGTVVMERPNRTTGKRGRGQWGFVARRGSDSKHVYVKRELAERIAESPAGSREDYLALWLVPPFYMDAGEGIWRTEHGGVPLAWDYLRGKQELPEDFLRDPREWLERMKREDPPTYDVRGSVAGTREWRAKNRATTRNHALSPSQQRRRREVLRTTVGGRPYSLVPIVETTDYSAETGSSGGTVRARVATPSDEVWDISDNRLVSRADGGPIGVVSNWGTGKNPWTFQTVDPDGGWLRLSGMLKSAPSRSEAIAKGERVIVGRAVYKNRARPVGKMRIGARQPPKQKRQQRIRVDQITAPAAWASALVNGDYSGLDEADAAALERWLKKLEGWSVVDVARDEAGEGQEARFTWSYRLYGGTAEGGEVLDYVIHKVPRADNRAAPPPTGGSAEFMEELRSLLAVGDRQVKMSGESRLGGPAHYFDTVFVNYINLPAGVGAAGGGAEAENNRAMFSIRGFHGADAHAPPPRGKVKIEQSVDAIDRRLRGKTGTPSQVARYLADFLNRVAREVPPQFTHTAPTERLEG